jgi:hypothetical protein
MRTSNGVLGIVRSAFALGVLSAGFLGAETPQGVRDALAELRRQVVSGQRASNSAPATPDWGLAATEILNVHSYDFLANTSTDVIHDDGNGYRYFGAPGVPYMGAPVQLPAGAHVTSLGLSHCSANAGDLVVALYDNGIGGSGGGGGTLVAGPLVSNAGCGVLGISADYLHQYEYGHPLYLVVWFAGNNFDATTKFNDVLIAWQREVSPAPAQASFGDVPPSDFGYQYVEALAASGITGGCGSGNYCPDQPVTRRQMAIFIAKALGLNWPG